ncbi:DUF4442 domain-containing protein [Formosa algae]|uniref:Thioesterase n=1 Tax=Formosa algae TaxID=225843 RepID=A0A9X0YRE1_9FLAO|nr:DUF4442 domain-containing protein [Formosa algae]MBP1841598.1 hypothetical protein [Formosa algae]MDQ0337009.1 hypothetical protein [Formosa algae]OEI80223.1 thioesterase [Formosa algae]
MTLTASKLNGFLMFKLPSAYICGVRTKSLNPDSCVVTVRHRWINQNPFKSMFWAVQGMAAELSTGALVMLRIAESKKKISMLVLSNEASFTKKATGKITFTCQDGHLIQDAIDKTVATGDGQTFWMKAIGVNQDGVEVSTFKFQWTVRVKA